MILVIAIISLFLITYNLLLKDNEIVISLLKSYIQDDIYDKKTTAFVLALIFPITLTHYLILKRKDKMTLKKFLTGFVIVVLLYLTGSFVYTKTLEVIDFSNKEIALTTEFTKQQQERITFYDKAYKQVIGSSQIALRNDSSFANIVNIVMTNQPTSLGGMFTTIQLIDPSANYSQVSSFYQQLNDLALNNREGFFQQEKALQSINATHENLIKQFPGSLYNVALGRSSFKYIPITSTRSQNVEKTHTDDNTTVL